MNICDDIAIKSKGLADHIVMNFPMPSVVIGFESKELCDKLAPLSSAVFAANGVKVYQFNDTVSKDDVLNKTKEEDACAGVYVTVNNDTLSYAVYDVNGNDFPDEIVNPGSVDEVRIGDYKAGIAAGCISLL